MSGDRELIVLPNDTAKPIIAAIDAARASLKIKMFLFTDPTLIEAVTKARKRRVDVRIMLNPARRSGEAENVATRKALEHAGVNVADSNPAFELTHEKSMIVDDAVAFVKSLNWETRNLTETRDYAVVTRVPEEVAEIVAGFEADWHRKPFDPGDSSRLIWCSNNGRARIAHFIDSTKHTLWKDKLIEGVGGLRIVQDVGAKVHRPKGLRLHAKMLLADGERAIVGSINLSPGSFDARRELAIETNDAAVVNRLHHVAREDWQLSHKLDLTDEGLLADLEKRGSGGAEELVLGDGR